MIDINPSLYISDKIKTEEEIIGIADKLKRDGKKIGLCIGGYDLLHPGQMTHLRSAHKFCDILIVGITSDKFNSERKGSCRPIYGEYLRAFSISQLNSVDFVFISKYRTAVEPIINIEPTFYIKGLDYRNKNTPGISAEREAIKSVDGEIKYTEDEKLSTTDIIRYIKENL